MGGRRAKTKFSDQIRAAIENCGTSRYTIAQETNLSESTLSRFMSGSRGLSMTALDELAEYLDLEIVERGTKRT